MTPQAREPDSAARAELDALRVRCEAWAGRALRLDHDLRTPLGTLMAVLEVLRTPEQDDPGERARTLAVMERQLQRLLGMVDGLHALGRELEAVAGDAGKQMPGAVEPGAAS